MDKKTQIIIKSLMTLVCITSLTACNTPGTYFSSDGANQPVKTSSTHYQPKIHVINAEFYSKTVSNKKSNIALWYDNNTYNYRVGASDVLSIIVWDHPELTTPTSISTTAAALSGLTAVGSSKVFSSDAGLLVNANGYIFFPYAGRIKVTGHTTEEIRLILSKKLKKYIKTPQLTVRVSGFRSQLIQVLGAVATQGSVPLNDKAISILDIISASGGITSTADTKHIYIIRGTGLKPDIYEINTKNPSNLLLAEKFRLYHDDIVYIPVAGIANWNTFLAQISPTITNGVFVNSLIK